MLKSLIVYILFCSVIKPWYIQYHSIYTSAPFEHKTESIEIISILNVNALPILVSATFRLSQDNEMIDKTKASTHFTL